MLPKHVAIIMDGNGRWAEARGQRRAKGHIKGAQVAQNIIEHAACVGQQHLTLFAFSTENWKRPEKEVNFLMSLLVRYLQREVQFLIKNNIRFKTIGCLESLPSRVQEVIATTIEKTEKNTGMELFFAINYGGRLDIIQATKKIAKAVERGELKSADITEELLSHHLWTFPFPEPDLLIRTSGEMRLSNFMLWQSAYTELHFSPVNWPDFTSNHFNKAVLDFQQRRRRFGNVDQVKEPVKESVKESLR